MGHDGIYGVPAGVYRATGRQSVTRIAVELSAIPSPAGPFPALDLTRAANPGRGDKVLPRLPVNGGTKPLFFLRFTFQRLLIPFSSNAVIEFALQK